jgi:hypothetical protein
MNIPLVLYSPDDLLAWLKGERRHHVVKAETVRTLVGGLSPDRYVERVVPVVPPALETVECPTCGGSGHGATFVDHLLKRGPDPCPSCDGKGRVTVLAVGAEQWRATHDSSGTTGEWETDTTAAPTGRHPGFTVERRTVVAYQLVGVETLPVVEQERLNVLEDYPRIEIAGPTYVREHYFGDPWPNCKPSDRMWLHRKLYEPWAAGLAPGDLVIRWRAIRVLDEPIIDQACPECGGARIKVEAGTFPHKSCPTCNGSGRVPLVLTPGLCEVTP